MYWCLDGILTCRDLSCVRCAKVRSVFGTSTCASVPLPGPCVAQLRPSKAYLGHSRRSGVLPAAFSELPAQKCRVLRAFTLKNSKITRFGRVFDPVNAAKPSDLRLSADKTSYFTRSRGSKIHDFLSSGRAKPSCFTCFGP